MFIKFFLEQGSLIIFTHKKKDLSMPYHHWLVLENF